MISFFCCLMPRETIESVGLLDEGFWAYGEDNDYCKRMKSLNKRFGIALGSYVHHDHGSTAALLDDEFVSKIKEDAKKRLSEKYSS